MGVLNVTPDSFYEGGRFLRFEQALEQACVLMEQGVDILDIGAESTCPKNIYDKEGLPSTTETDEEQRLYPLLEVLCSQFPTQKISVDTRNLNVAKKSLAYGVSFINHITSDLDIELAKLIATYPESTLILCHMRGTPRTMQVGDFYEGPIIPYLCDWFREQFSKLVSYGVKKEQVIIDPGMGFGKKKPDQDFEILRGIPELKKLGFPVLIGLSRKSFMGHVLGKRPDALLPGTIALNTYALMQGADIIRVHDVQEHKDVLQLLCHLERSPSSRAESRDLLRCKQ